jgi:hypothetical protein
MQNHLLVLTTSPPYQPQHTLNGKAYTLQEIATAFNCSRQRVHQSLRSPSARTTRALIKVLVQTFVGTAPSFDEGTDAEADAGTD